VSLKEAGRYGILEVAADGRIIGFEEKPKEPHPIPGQPDLALASMGNYVFKASVLIEALEHDALQDTSHDFGKNLIPALLKGARASTPTTSPETASRERGPRVVLARRRDGRLLLGRVDGPDLRHPPLNLYNQKWPIKSHSPQLPPAKFVFADSVSQRMGLATDSMVAAGCIISGGTIHPLDSLSAREDQLVLARRGVHPDGRGRGGPPRPPPARDRRQGREDPAKIEIGFDEEEDRKRFHVSDGGVVVLPKGVEIPSVRAGSPFRVESARVLRIKFGVTVS